MLQGSSLLKFQAERQINTPDIRVKMREGSYAYLNPGLSFIPFGSTDHGVGSTTNWVTEQYGDVIIWKNNIYANRIIVDSSSGGDLFTYGSNVVRYPITGDTILNSNDINGFGSSARSHISINSSAMMKSFYDWGETLLDFQAGISQVNITNLKSTYVEKYYTTNGTSWFFGETVFGMSYVIRDIDISGSNLIDYVPKWITALGPTTLVWALSPAFDINNTGTTSNTFGNSYFTYIGVSNNDGTYYTTQLMVSRKISNIWGSTVLVRDFYYLENSSETNYRQSSSVLKKLLAGVNRNGKDIIYYSFFEETINRNKLRISTFDSDNQEFERKEYILPTDFYINQMYAKNGLSHVYLYMRAGYQRFESGGKGITLNQFSYPPTMVLKSSDGINFGFESYFNKITNPTGVYGVTVLLTAAQLLYPYTSNFLVGVTTNQAFEYVLLGISNRIIVTRNLNEINLSDYISTYSNTNNEQVNIKLGNYNA